MTVKKPICGYCKAHQRNPTTIRRPICKYCKAYRKNPTTITRPICEYYKYKMASCILDMKGCRYCNVSLMTMLIIQLRCKYSFKYLWVMCFLIQ